MRIPQWGRLLWERLGETMYQPPPLLPPRFTLPTIPPPFPSPSSRNTLPTYLPPPIYITSSHNPSSTPHLPHNFPSPPLLTLVLLPLHPISTFETVGRNNVYQPPFLLSTIATPPPSDITFLTPPPFPLTPPPNLPQQQSPSMYKTLPRSPPLPPTLTSSPEFLSPPISIRMVRI